MSSEPAMPSAGGRHIGLLGAGCATLSLAARADELPHHQLTIYQPADAPADQDHIWGFWGGNGLEQPCRLARASWQRWRIITPEGSAEMTARNRHYYALKRSSWTQHCRERAKQAGVAFSTLPDRRNDTETDWFDSRPPAIPAGMMLQHFLGLEIRTSRPVFEPGAAILMDFRVDQSRGMHFIYLLPFSATEALVESTLFTPQREDDNYYLNAIGDYLLTQYAVSDFVTLRREKGVIPLGILPRRDAAIAGIGGNGGAIRPSSGYAFAFIQKQIATALVRAAGPEAVLAFRSPHRRIDLWMDAVLLAVLRQEPEKAPDLFLRMAQALTGDEFATFLSGDASWPLRLKVIMAMPKPPFLRALLRLRPGNLWGVTGGGGQGRDGPSSAGPSSARLPKEQRP